MRAFKIFALRWKSCIRMPYVWAFVVIAILAAMVPALSSRYDSASKLPIGLVNEDDGALSGKLEQYMSDYASDLIIEKSDREKALRDLAMGRLEAVYIINSGFTGHIRKGEYEGVITMVTAPASSAAQTLSETVINSAITVWMEEKALLEMDAFLTSEGLPFTDEDKQKMRAEFDGMLSRGSRITIVDHVPDPPKTGGEYAVLLQSTAWYAAFAALFVIASAGWVIESRRRALGDRMRSAGIRPLSALSGSALAIIALAMLGWCAATITASIILHIGLVVSLRLLLPVLLYMAGMTGITLAISSMLGKTVQLMLVAPVFTITQGILCGMLIAMPGWASTLVYLSYALPGRWLMLGGDALLHGGNPAYVLGQAACALVWLAAGASAVLAGSRRTPAAEE